MLKKYLWGLFAFLFANERVLAKQIFPINDFNAIDFQSVEWRNPETWFNSISNKSAIRLDFNIPSYTPSEIIVLSNYNVSDSLEIKTYDGQNIRFELKQLQLSKWIITPLDIHNFKNENGLILSVVKHKTNSTFLLQNCTCELFELSEFLSLHQSNRLLQGWLVGSCGFLFFIALIFSLRLKKTLIVRNAELTGVVFLLVIYTQSNVFNLNSHNYNVGLLVLNTMNLAVGFRYFDYVRTLNKGFGNFHVYFNWKILIYVFSVLILVNIVFQNYPWLGILIITLQGIASLFLLFLNIYHTYYFKWYNQFLIILLSITTVFLIMIHYFGDYSLALKVSIILNFELIVASFLAAKVIIWEFRENRSLIQHNLKMIRQMGLIQMESQENERKRIFQELNDDILYRLYELKKELHQSNEVLIPNKGFGIYFFKNLERLLKKLRKYTYQLFPPHLNSMNLIDLFQRELDLYKNANQLEKDNYEINLTWLNVPTEILEIDLKVILYRIFQLYLKLNTSPKDLNIKIDFNQLDSDFVFVISSDLESNVEVLQPIMDRLSLYLKILNADFTHSHSGQNWRIVFKNPEIQKLS